MSGYPHSPPKYEYDDHYRSHGSSRYTNESYGNNGYYNKDPYSRDSYTSHPPSSYVRGKERTRDDGHHRYEGRHPSRPNDKDEVTHSRLFIVHGSSLTEDDLRKSFKECGTIEDIRMVKKRGDKESLTGIAFVKFAKASEAAKAIEDVNGKVLPGSPKPLKVMVATRYGTGKDSVSEEELVRLFIRVPVDYTDEDIKEHFSKFGHIEYINLVKDRNTSKPKGVAYVKFFRFFDAAVALEDCDSSFRAVFAESRDSGSHGRPFGGGRGGGAGGGGGRGAYEGGPPPGSDHNNMGLEYLPNSPAGLLGLLPPDVAHPPNDPDATSSLRLLCAQDIDERNLTFLCEIIPGFRRCDVTSPGVANVSFNSVNWAQYAFKKLNGFEYPPGSRIVVKYIPDPHGSGRSGEMPFYPCSVELPAKKPMVQSSKTDADGRPTYKARLFIICSPRALTTPILEDAFCRFGSLIDVYTLPGKTVGYAKFDSRQAAEDCRHTLNGAEMAGCRLKVIEADEERPHADGSSDAKRRKT